MDPKAYWVGFNLVRGIGAVRLRALLDYFGDLQIAWGAPADALREAGLPARSLETLLKVRNQVDLELIWARVQSSGIQVLTWDDLEYPPLLKEIDQPPPVLYMRGHFSTEMRWAVAIVGTRRVTAYGRQAAEELAAFLASNGITVVSGLARGIDAIAHQASLRAGGSTLAVLGCGVDRVYPPEHSRLAAQITEQGALISDYAPGTPPDAANFPPRNRIISGLSLATIIIEAGETSGALITATFAAEQGRDVYALPGSIYAPQSKGTNRLISQGARPLLRVEDVLDSLNINQVVEYQAAQRSLPADATEYSLLMLMSAEPIHIDDLVSQSGISIERVSAALAMMELKGIARQVGGMNYVTAREKPEKYEA